MSLIIKGLDTPQTPKRIIIYPNGTIVDGDKKGTKILKAQAIEIPTPHGRLIDADELQELYADSDDLDLSNYDIKVAVVRQNIKDMPTILVEEKE